MNFKHMPEPSWQYGYPVVLTVMLGDLGAALPGVPPQRLALKGRPLHIDAGP